MYWIKDESIGRLCPQNTLLLVNIPVFHSDMLLFLTLVLWGQMLHNLSWKKGAELEAVAVPTTGAATAPKAPLEGHTDGRAAQSASAVQCIPATAGQPLLLVCTALPGHKWGEGGGSVLTPCAPCWWSNECYTARSHYCLLRVPALLTVRATSISLCSFLNGGRSYILCSLLFLVGLQFEHCTMVFSKVLFSQGISLLFLFEYAWETGHKVLRPSDESQEEDFYLYNLSGPCRNHKTPQFAILLPKLKYSIALISLRHNSLHPTPFCTIFKMFLRFLCS